MQNRRGAAAGAGRCGRNSQAAPKPWATSALPRARDARLSRPGAACADPRHSRRSARNFSDCLTNRRSIAVFVREGQTERGNRGPLQTGGLARPLLIRGRMPALPAGTTLERAVMSTFDNPFDPERRLNRTGCSCGRHRSQTEHDAQPQLRCAPIESEDDRYQGVVASAVMRAVFPKDAARRAFLKSVGASTALAALSQLFPLKTATEVFAQGGALEKKDQGRLHSDHLR